MFLPSRKFIALLLAVWLPLFSGNALAVAVAMQAGNGCCPAAMEEEAHPLHHEAAMAHQPAMEHDHSAAHQHEDASCANPDMCHLACTGYLAASLSGIAQPLPVRQAFEAVPVSFRSVSLALLLPPPLAVL